MCGISGFVDTGRRQDDRELRATVFEWPMRYAIVDRMMWGPGKMPRQEWPSATADFRSWICLPWGINPCGPRAVAM
jgi:hypothetical protein